jgi:hypothetical protein
MDKTEEDKKSRCKIVLRVIRTCVKKPLLFVRFKYDKIPATSTPTGEVGLTANENG